MGTRHARSRKLLAIVRYAKATMFPTPSRLDLIKRAKTEQLRREVIEQQLLRAVEQHCNGEAV